MTCRICGRDAESQLCELHKKAYENLIENYEDWKKAMNISWSEYLRKILENLYTGYWVREVIQHLLSTSNELGDHNLQDI